MTGSLNQLTWQMSTWMRPSPSPPTLAKIRDPVFYRRTLRSCRRSDILPIPTTKGNHTNFMSGKTGRALKSILGPKAPLATPQRQLANCKAGHGPCRNGFYPAIPSSSPGQSYCGSVARSTSVLAATKSTGTLAVNVSRRFSKSLPPACSRANGFGTGFSQTTRHANSPIQRIAFLPLRALHP